MTRHSLILLASGASALLLVAALGFQYLGGLAPCTLCIWQRWPHVVAALAGPAALGLAGPALPALGATAMFAGSAIGLYHSGVEQGWWEGPATCGAPDIAGLSAEELLARILEAPVVRCDEIPWEFVGLSMASWNALASLALAGVWLMVARRTA